MQSMCVGVYVFALQESDPCLSRLYIRGVEMRVCMNNACCLSHRLTEPWLMKRDACVCQADWTLCFYATTSHGEVVWRRNGATFLLLSVQTHTLNSWLFYFLFCFWLCYCVSFLYVSGSLFFLLLPFTHSSSYPSFTH